MTYEYTAAQLKANEDAVERNKLRGIVANPPTVRPELLECAECGAGFATENGFYQHGDETGHDVDGEQEHARRHDERYG